VLKSAVLLFFIPLSVARAQSPTPDAPQLIRDVRIFDGERVSEHRSVLIESGKIARIGGPSLKAPNAQVVDGTGRTLIPGLIDAHIHIPSSDQTEPSMHQALVFGVTTQLDMFTSPDRLDIIKKLRAEDRPDLSDVRTAGIGITAPGGHPTQMGGPSIPTLDDPARAQGFVDARITEGSDYIKIVHDDGTAIDLAFHTGKLPMLSNEVMKAIITAAHKRGKIVVVHVLSEQQARDAIEAGADGLAHLFIGDTVGPDFGAFAASHHVFVVPTLSTLYLLCGKSEGPAIASDPHLSPLLSTDARAGLERMKPAPAQSHFCLGTDAAVRQLLAAKVPILAGTDAPVPGSTFGASVHGEMALLVRDGLTPLQALAAATSLPAQHFHLNDRGRIRPGLRADLLLVQGDPTGDILATRDIVAVWKRGTRVQR